MNNILSPKGEWNWISTKLHIKMQFVPCRKHITSPQKRTDWCCLEKKSLFGVRTVWHTNIHPVGNMYRFSVLEQVIIIIYSNHCPIRGWTKRHIMPRVPIKSGTVLSLKFKQVNNSACNGVNNWVKCLIFTFSASKKLYCSKFKT
jgi:hypothetical protein